MAMSKDGRACILRSSLRGLEIASVISSGEYTGIQSNRILLVHVRADLAA